MRTQAEIQRAHDLLVGLICELPVKVPEDVEPLIRAQCDVLCWLLECDHNGAFGGNLAALENELFAKGYVLEKRGI